MDQEGGRPSEIQTTRLHLPFFFEIVSGVWPVRVPELDFFHCRLLRSTDPLIDGPMRGGPFWRINRPNCAGLFFEIVRGVWLVPVPELDFFIVGLCGPPIR